MKMPHEIYTAVRTLVEIGAIKWTTAEHALVGEATCTLELDMTKPDGAAIVFLDGEGGYITAAALSPEQVEQLQRKPARGICPVAVDAHIVTC